MQKETHILIANLVSYQLGYDSKGKYAYLLRYSSVLPDIWKDYPHHRGKDNHIKLYLGEARTFFLKGDMDTALMRLGVAFHYIADRWTLMTGSDERHNMWEREINKCAKEVVSNANKQIPSEYKQDLFYNNINSYTTIYSGNPSVDNPLFGKNTNMTFDCDLPTPLEFSEEDKIKFEKNKRLYSQIALHVPKGQNETLNFALIERPINYSWTYFDFRYAIGLCNNIAISIFSAKEPSEDLIQTRALLPNNWDTWQDLEKLNPPANLKKLYTQVLHEMKMNEQKYNGEISKLKLRIREYQLLIKNHGNKCNCEINEFQKICDFERKRGFFRGIFSKIKYIMRERKTIRIYRNKIQNIQNEISLLENHIQEKNIVCSRKTLNLRNKLSSEAKNKYEAERDWYDWSSFISSASSR